MPSACKANIHTFVYTIIEYALFTLLDYTALLPDNTLRNYPPYYLCRLLKK